MKRTNLAILMVIALVAMVFAQIVQAKPETVNDVVTYEAGATLNMNGTLKIQDVTVTASAAELNTMDGVTATATQINSAADASARVVSTSVTNGQAITLSASTPVIALTGIGGANDTTNTVTIATPYPVGVEFTVYVTAASSNLITIADSTTVLALGSAWLGDGTDVLKFYTVATNSAVKVSSSDN